MENKTDLMLEVFANYNTKKDPRVQSNKSFKGNSKYLGAENITTNNDSRNIARLLKK